MGSSHHHRRAGVTDQHEHPEPLRRFQEKPWLHSHGICEIGAITTREKDAPGSESTKQRLRDFKCGFGNLGHFARDFRKMFGELPSEVLARTRRGP